VIHPAVFRGQNGEKLLRYIVFLPGDPNVYEWTWFPSASLEENASGLETAQKQLNGLTVFSFDYYKVIRDQQFWNDFVLPMDGVKYRYLQPFH
jgi:hypothetical protein